MGIAHLRQKGHDGEEKKEKGALRRKRQGEKENRSVNVSERT